MKIMYQKQDIFVIMIIPPMFLDTKHFEAEL